MKWLLEEREKLEKRSAQLTNKIRELEDKKQIIELPSRNARNAEDALRKHQMDRPGFLDNLLNGQRVAEWNEEENILKERFERAKQTFPEGISYYSSEPQSIDSEICRCRRELKYRDQGIELLEKRMLVLKKSNDKKAYAKARVAQADQKARAAAKTVKSRLKKYELCPYCENPIGEFAHADHIIPIALGGLSIESNMVYICRNCNLGKSDLTLREFCIVKSYDFSEIAKRLAIKGKRI